MFLYTPFYRSTSLFKRKVSFGTLSYQINVAGACTEGYILNIRDKIHLLVTESLSLFVPYFQFNTHLFRKKLFLYQVKNSDG
jgi:hypothetical protein